MRVEVGEEGGGERKIGGDKRKEWSNQKGMSCKVREQCLITSWPHAKCTAGWS